ncbi:MAG: hypothetical protein AABY22_11830 [Nanoarchaeota archaeon]
MKCHKMSVGKLINELKLIESESRNKKKELRVIIDYLSDCGIKK